MRWVRETYLFRCNQWARMLDSCVVCPISELLKHNHKHIMCIYRHVYQSASVRTGTGNLQQFVVLTVWFCITVIVFHTSENMPTVLAHGIEPCMHNNTNTCLWMICWSITTCLCVRALWFQTSRHHRGFQSFCSPHKPIKEHCVLICYHNPFTFFLFPFLVFSLSFWKSNYLMVILELLSSLFVCVMEFL